MWRGHKRGLNKWCGRGQVWASVKTSHLFVAAAGQQVSTQLKISAQGRRPSPAAAGAQMKMFWWTLSVHTSPFLKQYLVTILCFFLLFFGNQKVSSPAGKRTGYLQAHVTSAGESWVRMEKVHSLSHVTQAGLNPNRWTWSAVCTSSPSLRSNYPNNSKPNEPTVIYWFTNDSSATFSGG